MKTTLIHLTLIVLAIAAVFGRSINDGLTWDDQDLIVDNPHVAEGNPAGLIWHWRHSHEELYIPVVYTVWWCISATVGINAPFFHGANLVVYVGCCWLVYWLLRRLIGRPWPALAGALLFALHPLQVEPVAWATGMKDLLCTFFSLLAIVLYLRPRFYWAATICFLAAILCKPAAVVVPLIVAAIDLLMIHQNWRQTAWKTGLWLAAAVVIGLKTMQLQPPTNLRLGPLWARPLLAADAIDWYLFKLIWPSPMAIDYGHTPLRVLSWQLWGVPWIAVAWVIPVALAGVVIYLKRPALTAAGLIFVLGLLPVLGLEPFLFQRISTVADRYAQFALLGPALAAAWAVSRWNNWSTLCLAFIVLALLATISFIDTGYWANDVTLYRHAIAVNPLSVVAHNNLSVALYRAGDRAAAAEEFATVIRLAPDDPDSYVALGNFQLTEGKELMPGGNAHAAFDALRRAVILYQDALKLEPDNAIARSNLHEAQALLNGP